MAIVIESYAHVANWFAGGAKTVTGRSWNSGDVIIVFAALENGSNENLGAPTNGNLTFTQRSFFGESAGQFCEAGIWTANAGSTQSNQTISLPANGNNHNGLAVWVVSGVDTATIAGMTANTNTSRYSQAVTAGDLVLAPLGDWNASNPPNKTPNPTLSSVATERYDAGNGNNYGLWIADWIVGTTGTGSFGPNTWTGLKPTNAGVRMSPTAGGGPPQALSAVLAGTSSQTATGARTRRAIAAQLNGTSSVTATGQSTTALSAQLDGTSDLTATGQSTTALSAQLDGTSDLTATGQSTTALSAQLDGTSDLTATGQSTTALSAQLDGTSDLTATGASTTALSAQLDGTSDLTATGAGSGAAQALSAQLDGTSDLTATGQSTTALSVQLDGTSDLTAIGARTAGLTAQLDGTSNMLASGNGANLLSAVLAGTSGVTATGQSTTALSAQLDGTSDLTATGQSTTTLSAQLDGTSGVTATGARTAALAAQLDGTSDLTAAGSTSGALSAQLDGTSDLAATGVRTVSVLSAQLDGTSDLTATGVRTVPLSAQLNGTSGFFAAGDATARLSAALSGTSDLTATGVRIRELAAVLGGTSSLLASGDGTRQLSIQLDGTSAFTAIGIRIRPLSASITGTSNLRTGGSSRTALSASLVGRSILVEGRGSMAYKKERSAAVAPLFPGGGVGLDAYAEYLREVKALGGMFNTVAGLPSDGIDRLPTPSRYPVSHVGPVFACVATRMMVFAEIEFAFQERLDNGRQGDLYRDGRLKVLERPWAGATTGDLAAVLELDASTAGNSFWVLTEDGTELTRLDPQFTSIVMEQVSAYNGSGTVGLRKVGYIVEYPESEPVVYLADEVAHYMPIPDPNAPWRGMSWITPLLGSEHDVDSFIQSHKRNTLKNRAAPALAVVFPPLAAKEVVNAYRDEFDRLHGGIGNQGKTLFTGGGADIKTIGMTWEDLDLRAVQGHGETRIAACAGVPPIVVGLSEGLSSATYSNYGQARRRFADGTLRHLWRCASGALETLVPPPRKKDRLWYSDRFVAFLQEDVKDEADIRKSHASTIRQLIDIGFEPSAAVKAVTSGDLASLAGNHTGLYSVQLQPPLPLQEGNDGEEVDLENDEEFDDDTADETEEVNA